MNQKSQSFTHSGSHPVAGVGFAWFASDPYFYKKKWRTRITINGKSIHLGRYDDEEMAAMAYDLVARKVLGKFAYLNFFRPPLFLGTLHEQRQERS